MNKIVKAGILLVILGIPAFVFIFLHGFGENRFEIPLYYENGVDTAFAECNWQIPHTVDIKELAGKITVVSFDPDQVNDLIRLNTDYEDLENFQTVLYYDSANGSPSITTDRLIKKELRILSGGDLSGLLACSFVINESELKEYPLVLVDPDRMIRGYYYISDNEEFERLIHELNILKENTK